VGICQRTVNGQRVSEPRPRERLDLERKMHPQPQNDLTKLDLILESPFKIEHAAVESSVAKIAQEPS
jgi:hypothetical protein